MATVSITGDFSRLLALVAELDTLGGQAFRQDVNKRLAAASLKLIADGFERGTNPYGRSWKPTTSRDGQTLRDTGRLLNSFGPYGSTTPTGFGLSTNVKYAGVHQYGHVTKAINAPYLVFKMPFATKVFGRGSQRLKRAKVLSSWVSVKQVVIPQRQMVPEQDIGSIWMDEYTREVDAAMAETMGH